MSDDCSDALPPKVVEGLRLFNRKQYFESHEELEDAWRAEKGSIRYLYQGVLQAAVTYFHITRGNYEGALKLHERCMKLLKDYPDVCRGIQVGKLKNDLNAVIKEVKRLGRERIKEFDTSLFKDVDWSEQRTWTCDRCGTRMYEKNCKVVCPNCGNQFDCSDLNIYFD
jgi:predicted metal-dependent hydrolase